MRSTKKYFTNEKFINTKEQKAKNFISSQLACGEMDIGNRKNKLMGGMEKIKTEI